VTEFARELRDYLKNSKPRYVEIMATEKALSPEAEGLLKEAIAEVKKIMLATA
jgi:F-type H+/Na+-transporting ATPase subunit alpha